MNRDLKFIKLKIRALADLKEIKLKQREELDYTALRSILFKDLIELQESYTSLTEDINMLSGLLNSEIDNERRLRNGSN